MPPTQHKKILVRIGTRGSPLALYQAREVLRLIKRKHPFVKIEEIIIKTSGDKFSKLTNKVLGTHRYTGKGLFVKEIEDALLAKRIDVAVHSLKDVPAELPSGLQLTAYLVRENPADLFISLKYKNLAQMPKGTTLGTSSPRRAAQALALNPKIKIVAIRGNVETRIRKMIDGECDATILAIAGITRLGLLEQLKNLGTQELRNFIPAIGQGIICVESRREDDRLNSLLRSSLNHGPTEAAALAERGFLRTVGGDCHTPIAAHAKVVGRNVKMTGLVVSPNGRKMIKRSARGKDPVITGSALGEKLIKLGARKIIGLDESSLWRGKTVLFTKLHIEGDGLAKKLASYGAKIIHKPLIKIRRPSDGFKSLDEAIAILDTFDWLVFTSQNSVISFFGRLPKNVKRLPKIAVVGPSTANTVKSFGKRISLTPAGEFSSFGLSKEFRRIKMKNKNVLFPRAKSGRDELIAALKKQGAKVKLVEAYETIPVKISLKHLPDAVVFSSPSAVRSFVNNFGNSYDLKSIRTICVGRSASEAARKAGLNLFIL